MFGYCRFIVYSFLVFLFISCSSIQYKSYQKAFDKEDNLIISAIEYEMKNDISGANKVYEVLYKKSRKREYAIRNATLYVGTKKYKKAYNLLLDLHELNKKDKTVLHLLSETYLQSRDYKNAILYSKKLLKLEKSERNYLLVANSYIIGSKFQML